MFEYKIYSKENKELIFQIWVDKRDDDFIKMIILITLAAPNVSDELFKSFFSDSWQEVIKVMINEDDWDFRKDFDEDFILEVEEINTVESLLWDSKL